MAHEPSIRCLRVCLICAKASGPFARTGPQWPILFQGFLLAPGEEIVPSKEPLIKLVAELNEPVRMKFPVAPENRPVPP